MARRPAPALTAKGLAKARRGVALAALCAALLVAALALLGGNWQAAWDKLSWSQLALLLAATIAANVIRFLRYPVFSRALKLRISPAPLALSYVAGMALIPTPGKVGTVLRLWLLHKWYGLAYRRTAPMLLLDTLSDFLALMLLLGLVLPWLKGGLAFHAALLAVAAVLVAVVLLLRYPVLLKKLVKALYACIGKPRPRLFAGLLRALMAVRRLCRPRVLGPAVALSAAGWSTLFVALWYLLHSWQTGLGYADATFALTASIILGGASFLPGGIGGTEATLLALLALAGVPFPLAVLFTVLMRLATLWLPVAVGFAVLPLALGYKPARR